MTALLGFFLPFVGLATLGMLGLGVGGILLFSAMGGDYRVPAGMMPFLALYASIFVSAYLGVRRNLSWVLNLPISKARIVLGNYLVNLCLVSAFVLAGVLLIPISDLATGHGLAFTRDLIDIARRSGEGFNGGRGRAGMVVISAAVLGFNLFNLVLMSVGAPFRMQMLARQRVGLSNVSRRVRAYAALGFAIAFLYFSRFGSSFGIALFVLPFMHGLGIWLNTRTMGMAAPQRKRWQLVAAALALGQVLLLFGTARARTSLPPGADRTEALRYLGAFGPAPERADMEFALISMMDADTIYFYGDIYRRRYCGGRLIGDACKGVLTGERVISTKVNPSAKMAAASLFDARELGLADVRAFLAAGQFRGPSRAGLASGKLGEGEVIELMASADAQDQVLGVYLARYRRSAAVLEALERSLPKFEDMARTETRFTRALLTGRHPDESGAAGAPFLKVDCLKFVGMPLTKLEAPMMPEVNACARELALMGKPLKAYDLDRTGWIDYPLSAGREALLRALFTK